jgi:hypothetical protein
MAAQIQPDETPTLSHHKIARNASIYFVGQVATWLVNIVTLSIIPRTLGERAMGELAFAMSTVMTIQLLLMLGGEMFMTKEVGRDREEAARLIGALLGLRLALIPVLVILSCSIFAVQKVDVQVWRLGGVLLLSSSIALLADPLRAVLLGWEHAKQVSMLDIIFAIIPLATIPFLRFGIMTQAVALVVSNLLVFVLRFLWIRRIIPVRPTFQPTLWGYIILWRSAVCRQQPHALALWLHRSHTTEMAGRPGDGRCLRPGKTALRYLPLCADRSRHGAATVARAVGRGWEMRNFVGSNPGCWRCSSSSHSR